MIPKISIGLDTVGSIYNNLEDNSDFEEIASDALLEIGFGAGEILASKAISKNFLPKGKVQTSLMGALVGIGVHLVTDYININGKTIREWADVFVDWAIDGIKSLFD